MAGRRPSDGGRRCGTEKALCMNQCPSSKRSSHGGAGRPFVSPRRRGSGLGVPSVCALPVVTCAKLCPSVAARLVGRRRPGLPCPLYDTDSLGSLRRPRATASPHPVCARSQPRDGPGEKSMQGKKGRRRPASGSKQFRDDANPGSVRPWRHSQAGGKNDANKPPWMPAYMAMNTTMARPQARRLASISNLATHRYHRG